MQRKKSVDWVGTGALLIMFAAWLIRPAIASAASEQRFDVLKIGTQTYHNVTVTTKSKTYVFLLHAGGMTNLKVSELPPDVLLKLGYTPPTPKPGLNRATLGKAENWARTTLARVETPEVRSWESRLSDLWREQGRPALQHLPPITPAAAVAVGGILLLFYLFGCYCGKLICDKTGKKAGLLIWVPVLQNLPMLRAADMSGWWLLPLLLPGLNLIPAVIWAVKITQARNKSGWIALLLLLPLLNVLAFLFLAFSSGRPRERAKPRMEIMTLEAA